MNTSTTISSEIFDLLVTRKGQVTIPIDVRRAWKLKKGDRVKFKFNNKENKVQLMPTGSIVESTAGVFRSIKHVKTARGLRLEAELAIASETLKHSADL